MKEPKLIQVLNIITDEKHFNLCDVTNTIHAQVGAVRLNMEVLIAEFYESNITTSEE